jgi:prolipoprotein diacylglyceryltransferase
MGQILSIPVVLFGLFVMVKALREKPIGWKGKVSIIQKRDCKWEKHG